MTEKIKCKHYEQGMESGDCIKYAEEWVDKGGYYLCGPCYYELYMAYQENAFWEERGGWD